MAQNGVLGEHLVIELGDQKVLSIPIGTPYLAQLDGLHRHGVTPQFRLAAAKAGVNWRRSYEGAVPVTLAGGEVVTSAAQAAVFGMTLRSAEALLHPKLVFLSG